MSNAARVGRSYYSTTPDMVAFDQLPPTARAALREAAFNWAAASVLNKWRKAKPGFKTGLAIRATVQAWDKSALNKVRTKR